MTSSNVSNMLVQISDVKGNAISAPKGDLKKANNLFDETLKNVAGSDQSLKTNQFDLPRLNDDQSYTSNDVRINSTKEVKVTDSKDNLVSSEEKVTEKIEEVTDEIKNVIEDELDVTKEDIEKAMENLGLTAIDLLNPQHLAEVVAQLIGEDESLSLVMSEDFKGILDIVTELTNQLLEETGFSLNDFKIVLKEMEKIDPTVAEIPEKFLIKPEALSEEGKTTLDISVEAENVEKEAEVIETTGEMSKGIFKEDKNETIISPEEITEGEVKEQVKIDVSSETDNFQFQKQLTPKEQTNDVRADAVVLNEPKFEFNFNPEAEVVTLPTGERVYTTDIANQLVEQAKIFNSSEQTTMEMTLNPEGLGKIFMEVTQKGDEITAKIFTENDVVKQALESQMANLRLDFNQNGTKVTSIEVSVGTHEFERNLEEGQQNNERQNEQAEQSSKRSKGINLNNLDELSGLMSEEDILIAQMMKDNGNTLDFQA